MTLFEFLSWIALILVFGGCIYAVVFLSRGSGGQRRRNDPANKRDQVIDENGPPTMDAMAELRRTRIQ